jgi:flagellar motor switch protein FliM
MNEKKVQRYNFKRPDRVSKNHMRSLHFIHDRFSRNVSSPVSAVLRTVVEVSLENVVQISCSEFLNTVTDPTCYVTMSLKPLEGLAALELTPDLAFAMIDRLLGGAGRPVADRRQMTEIEQNVIQSILKLVVDNLRESWKPAFPVEFAVHTIETHPHMAQIAAPNEMVIHFQFHVRMRELVTKMHLAIPTMLLEPIIHVFDQEDTRRRVIHNTGLLHTLRGVPVNLSICTAETPFPIESLLSLQVGDTIVLNQWQDSPAIIKVAGRAKLQAKARMDSARKVFAVTGYAQPRIEEFRHGPTSE